MSSAVRRVAALVTLLLAVALPAADSNSISKGFIVISGAWTRPTAAGMPMGVAYFVVQNQGASADAIVAASTPAAAHVEFHQTTLSDGMARMRPLQRIDVPAQGTVAVTPGGIHLMLVDLKGPLVAGSHVPLELEFGVAGKVTIRLAVEQRAE